MMIILCHSYGAVSEVRSTNEVLPAMLSFATAAAGGSALRVIAPDVRIAAAALHSLQLRSTADAAATQLFSKYLALACETTLRLSDPELL
eukprot:SAG11_NODE_20796_length_438_cov_0.634218_1_plen_90_part_00